MVSHKAGEHRNVTVSAGAEGPFFLNQMWVLESLGAWYRGATVLQGEENAVEYVDGADLDLRGWWSQR